MSVLENPYALGLALGAFFAWNLWTREALRERWIASALSSPATPLILLGFVGAKALAAFGEWERYGHTLETWGGPLAVQGALVSILIGMALWAWVTGRPTLAILDASARALVLLLACVRVGCFSVGCCYGVPCELPWAIDGPESLARHPTQLYELALVLGLGAVLFAGRRRGSFLARPGASLALFLVAYGLGRFGLEFLRDDTEPLVVWVSYPQVVSALMLTAGVVVARAMGRAEALEPRGRRGVGSPARESA